MKLILNYDQLLYITDCINCLVQNCGNSNASAMELLQPYIEPKSQIYDITHTHSMDGIVTVDMTKTFVNVIDL